MNTFRKINTLSHAMTDEQLAQLASYLIGYFAIELERGHGEIVLKRVEEILNEKS